MHAKKEERNKDRGNETKKEEVGQIERSEKRIRWRSGSSQKQEDYLKIKEVGTD